MDSYFIQKVSFIPHFKQVQAENFFFLGHNPIEKVLIDMGLSPSLTHYDNIRQ